MGTDAKPGTLRLCRLTELVEKQLETQAKIRNITRVRIIPHLPVLT